MRYGQDRTWLEIDLDVLSRNYRNIAAALGDGCRVMAVLKANAYGLGASNLARLFADLDCSQFAVATIEEAMELRESGIKTPLLVLGPVNPRHASLAGEHDIQLTIADLALARALSDAARTCGKRVAGHLKLDSGLSRFGWVLRGREDEAVEEMEQVLRLPGLEVTGAFTHTSAFSGPDSAVREKAELELFARVALRLRLSSPGLKLHCLSSSTLLDFPEYRYDFVRVGVLYMGAQPDYSARLGVSQAVELRSRVVQVKFLEKDVAVSYEGTFVTGRPTRIALVSIGYADGLRRSLSNRGSMIVRGRRVPIVGKICCDTSILDVTDVPGVQVGDIVTLFGRDGEEEQYPWHYAALYPGSISEVTATLTARVPRFYLRAGKLEE